MTKRVVITGSASGIGAALSHQMSEAGWHVIGLDRKTASENDRQCDLADASAIRNAIDNIDGPIDALAHVAGVPGTADPKTIVAVNTLAPITLTKAILPKLRSGSSIVAVSSVTASRNDLDDEALDALLAMPRKPCLETHRDLDGKAAYEQSKALLNRWILRSVSTLASQKIRINGVSPGPVETPILADFRESIGADRISAAAELTGRHGHPGEIAAVVAFLLSDKASWVNGANIRADGGYHALRNIAETAVDKVGSN